MERRRQGGFTLIEIMVSMGLMVIGLMCILALHMTTVKGNRVSRQLERARVLSQQLMEDLRGRPLNTLGGIGDHPFDTVTAVEGSTYVRSYSIAAVTGSSELMLLVTRVSFPDDQDVTLSHSATLQMLRTAQEAL